MHQADQATSPTPFSFSASFLLYPSLSISLSLRSLSFFVVHRERHGWLPPEAPPRRPQVPGRRAPASKPQGRARALDPLIHELDRGSHLARASSHGSRGPPRPRFTLPDQQMSPAPPLPSLPSSPVSLFSLSMLSLCFYRKPTPPWTQELHRRSSPAPEQAELLHRAPHLFLPSSFSSDLSSLLLSRSSSNHHVRRSSMAAPIGVDRRRPPRPLDPVHATSSASSLLWISSLPSLPSSPRCCAMSCRRHPLLTRRRPHRAASASARLEPLSRPSSSNPPPPRYGDASIPREEMMPDLIEPSAQPLRLALTGSSRARSFFSIGTAR